MDQSAVLQGTIAAYGGSDSTTPSFNRSRYVRYASVHGPRDFGEIREIRLDLEGVVGAESGTQSLFFRFRTLEPARIGARRVLLNYWTDRYITLSLRDADNPIALGADGFADSAIVDLQALEILAPPTYLDLGYVSCGYWDKGYAELDCVSIESPSTIVLGAVSDPDQPFGSPFGRLMPPGDYFFVITSSQWPQLPYRVQIVVAPQPALSTEVEMSTQPSAHLGLLPLAADLDMGTEVGARLVQTLPLQATVEMEAQPSGVLERLSPYG